MPTPTPTKPTPTPTPTKPTPTPTKPTPTKPKPTPTTPTKPKPTPTTPTKPKPTPTMPTTPTPTKPKPTPMPTTPTQTGFHSYLATRMKIIGTPISGGRSAAVNDPSAVDAFGQQSPIAPHLLHDEFDVSEDKGNKTCKNHKLDEVGHEKTYDNGKSVVDNGRKESDADDCFSKEIRKLKEKYEQDLKGTRARELMHAKKAAILAKDPSAVDAFGQQSLVAPDFLHDEFDVSKVMGKKTCKNPKLDEVGHEKTYDNGKSVVDNERKESDADDCFSKEIRKLKEKYEQELKDTRARELIHAKKAALLAKQLKDQQIKYDSLIIKEIQSHSEQKPQEELQKKDNEIHEQIQKRQIAEANLKNADLSLLVNVEKEIDKQLKLSQVSSSDSAAIQSVELSVLLDRDKEIDNIKKYICQLEAEETKLRLNLEAAKMGCQLEESMLLYHLEEARHRLKKTECSSETLEFDVMAALTQLHDIFLCPCEIGYMSLRKLLDAPDSKIFRIRVVPGKKKDQLPEPQDAAQGIRNPRYVVPPRRTPQIKLPDLKKMSPFGKFVMSDLIDDVFRLHRAGLCLNGKFGLNHFFYVPASKRIKLDPQLKSRASKRTLDGMNLDYFALHGTIVLILSLYEDSIPVPFDLKYLLGLMSCEDPVSKEVLIRYNASLMTELQKRDHFITLYDRMEQLDREDEAEHVAKKNFRSEKVLKFISAAYTDEWASLLYDNDFIEMVCTKYKNDTQKVLSGPRDLLMTWRHNFTHLHEKSTAFEDKDEMDMLDYVASGVLNQFQEGMHSIGQLEIPHLAHTMK